MSRSKFKLLCLASFMSYELEGISTKGYLSKILTFSSSKIFVHENKSTIPF